MGRDVNTTVGDLTLDDVLRAARGIGDVAIRTPVLTSRTLDGLTGASVFLKCENFQRAGAFKFRGAYNALSSLPRQQLERGVAAYSSGNHAQAVSLAARLLGTRAVILMPEDTPTSKRDATLGYGAEIVTYDRYTGDRAALGRALAERRHLHLIAPYDDIDVMAGQGTAALELIADVKDLDVFIAPIGGGGLMAGCASVIAALSPATKILGIEPQDGDDTHRSLATGSRVAIPVARTIADGLAADIPGEITFSINRRLLSEIVLVTDQEILEAMQFLFERMKIVVEPSGAVGVAALVSGRIHVHGNRVGVVISGGNIDASRFCQLMTTQV